MSKELLQQAIDFAEYCLEELELSYMASNQAKRLIEKSEEALAKQEQLGEPVAFFDWYDNAHWGNEDFKESCHRSWNAAIKYTTPQPKQEQGEPVAWMSEHRFDELRKGFTVMTTLTKQRAFEDDVAIYTTPPQRKPLTDEQIGAILEGVNAYGTRLYTFARAIEVAHNIKE